MGFRESLAKNKAVIPLIQLDEIFKKSSQKLDKITINFCII